MQKAVYRQHCRSLKVRLYDKYSKSSTRTSLRRQRRLSYNNNIMPLFHIMRLFLLFYSPAVVIHVPHIHIMFYTFRFYSRTRQRRPFGNRCLEHFPGEYDQFGMIKLRLTAPGSAGYVHIPQGVTVFHKSLATRRPRVYMYMYTAAVTTIHAVHTIDRRRRFYPRAPRPRRTPIHTYLTYPDSV